MCVCLWINGQWGLSQLKVLGVKGGCHSYPALMCQVWLPPKNEQRSQQFPESGVGQGPTSLTYPSLKDEEESARPALCRISSLNPVRAAGKMCCFLDSMRLRDAKCWSYRECVLLSLQLKTQSFFSAQVSLSFRFGPVPLCFFVKLFLKANMSRHLTWQKLNFLGIKVNISREKERNPNKSSTVV